MWLASSRRTCHSVRGALVRLVRRQAAGAPLSILGLSIAPEPPSPEMPTRQGPPGDSDRFGGWPLATAFTADGLGETLISTPAMAR